LFSLFIYSLDDFIEKCAEGDLEGTQEMIQNGAKVDAKDSTHGYTGLHQASSLGHESIIRCLIVNGASIDAKDNSNCTPLMSAASSGQADSVKILLLSGADNTENEDGKTAFSFATHEDVKDILE